VWEDELREAGSYSNPRTHLNWTQHYTWPNGPKYGVAASLAEKCICTKMTIVAGSDVIWTSGLMHMKIYSMGFLESICTPESKSICGRGGCHKMLLFWNLKVTRVNPTLFPSCPSFLSNKRECTFSLSK
jgi:hypothetical protein